MTLRGAMPPERHYSLAGVELRDTAVAVAGGASGPTVTVEARVAMWGNRETTGESRASWGFVWPDGVAVTVCWGNTAFGDAADERYLRLTVACHDTVMVTEKFTTGFSMRPGGFNTLAVSRDTCGTLDVSGGTARLAHLATVKLPPRRPLPAPALTCRGRAKVMVCVAEWQPDLRAPLLTPWTHAALCDRFERSTDPLEGFWAYFDRANDPDYARPGGRYRLACVAEPGGGYSLIYVDGAAVNGAAWQCGMLKGRLTPTVFENQFDLQWVDAMLEPITDDIHARLENPVLLVLDFPLLKTTLRLAKLPRERW